MRFDLGPGTICIGGVPAGRVTVCEVRRGDRDQSESAAFKATPVTLSLRVKMLPLDARLIDIILGRLTRTVGSHTLQQCLRTAETIAMGAWAVRCAETYIRPG